MLSKPAFDFFVLHVHWYHGRLDHRQGLEDHWMIIRSWKDPTDMYSIQISNSKQPFLASLFVDPVYPYELF